jgi:hypothetical protein
MRRSVWPAVLPLAIAMSGALLAVTIAGPRWQPQTSGVTSRLRGVSAISNLVAWASGAKGTVLRTFNGGQTWDLLHVPDAEQLDFRDIDAVSERDAYVLSIGPGEASRIYKTTDAGVHWTLQLKNTDPGVFLDAMAFWTPARGIAFSDSIGRQFVIFSTTDGRTWSRVPSTSLPEAYPPRARTPPAVRMSRCSATKTCGSGRQPRGCFIRATVGKHGPFIQHRSPPAPRPASSRSVSATLVTASLLAVITATSGRRWTMWRPPPMEASLGLSSGSMACPVFAPSSPRSRTRREPGSPSARPVPIDRMMMARRGPHWSRMDSTPSASAGAATWVGQLEPEDASRASIGNVGEFWIGKWLAAASASVKTACVTRPTANSCFRFAEVRDASLPFHSFASSVAALADTAGDLQVGITSAAGVLLATVPIRSGEF